MKRRKYAAPHFFTDREAAFLEKHVAGTPYAVLTEMFNRRFGLNLTESQVNRACLRRGLANGRDCRFRPGEAPFNKGMKGIHLSPDTEFRPGHRPANTAHVGDERVVDGYVQVRIHNPTGKVWKNWKPKHRIVWEQAHGRKIPKGCVVIFADRDNRNFDPANLMLLTRAELAVMNRRRLITGHRLLTETGKAVADIKILARKRLKNRRK